MTAELCRTCKWYSEWSCHRYPPTFERVGLRPGQVMVDTVDEVYEWVHAVTPPTGFCGEHQPADPPLPSSKPPPPSMGFGARLPS